MSKAYNRYRQRGEGDAPLTDMDLGEQPKYGRPLLGVENLRVYFGSRRKPVRAVDGVTFTIFEGECVGLVGESGCGKSTLGRAILRMEKARPGSCIVFGGRDVTTLKQEELAAYREQAQMVFQDPYGSLNPRMTIGNAILEVLKAHGIGDRRSRRTMAGELLTSVGLDPAYMDRYPHEFSGGQRQRIGIARALAVNPALLIAGRARVRVGCLRASADFKFVEGLATATWTYLSLCRA